MIVRHTSHEADPRQRGIAFGAAHRDGVERALTVYERLWAESAGLGPEEVRSLGARVAERLAASRPGLWAEVEGLAAGAAVEPEMLAAMNARTELLAGAGAKPECSTLALSTPRAMTAVLAQNWDWHPDLAAARVVWTVREPDGGWFTTLTEAGILAKIGVNSRGLGVCLNILAGSRDGGVDGTPIHVLLRVVLAECGSVEEVAELLAGEPVCASSCFTVAAASGDDGTESAAFEISPAGVARLEPDDGLLLHTNHFLRPPVGTTDVIRDTWPDTLTRLEELRRLVDSLPDSAAPAAAAIALRSHAGLPTSICYHGANNPDYRKRTETLASVLIEPARARMTLSDGPPCSADREVVTP